jgi:hypothetical protein
LSAGTLATAALIMLCDDPRVWLTAWLLAAGPIGAYTVSRWLGLPSLDEDRGDWVNPLGDRRPRHRGDNGRAPDGGTRRRGAPRRSRLAHAAGCATRDRQGVEDRDRGADR